MENPEEVQDDIEELEGRLEELREKKSEMEQLKDLNERLDRARSLLDDLEGLEDALKDRRLELRGRVKLIEGDAYECESCGDVVDEPEFSHKREEWHDEGICRSCHRQRVYDENREDVEDELVGATIVDVGIDDPGTMRYRDESIGRVGKLHSLSVEVDGEEFFIDKGHHEMEVKKSDG